MKCDDDDSWKLSSTILSSVPKEVPWYLDDGTDRVHVVGTRGATDFVLPAENSTFEESGRTLVCETFDNRRREKTIGFKRIERGLPVGTSLNVVWIFTGFLVGLSLCGVIILYDERDTGIKLVFPF
ncbi:hypothetical protein KIW84_064612 [Lathyrus oleraceus]|uniref:RING-type E3 ubiquitin transferase n=1 Tax=Pisum sativum TaxID=3888 RepID=A0A9D4WAQ9_PEA|nr:hypothetical protein KIW84_064612 [Pisum sativum]